MRLNHAQFDRLSVASLFQDLSAAYDSLSLRSAPNFRDVLAHRSRLHTPTAFQFWEGLLKGSSMTEIGSHGTDDHTERGAATWIEQERKIPFTLGPSRFTVAIMHKAAWALTLAQETKSRDLVFGQVASGRNTTQDGIEDVLGPCANPVPVRVTLQPTWTVQNLLQHIQSQHVRAMEFETVHFEDIVKSSTPWPQDTSFGSVIQYQNIPLQEDVKFGKLAAVCETHQFNIPCRTPHFTSRFTDSNILSLSLSGSRGQFDEDQVNSLLTVLGDILGLLATDIRQSVENLL